MGNKDLGLSMELENAFAKIAGGALDGLTGALKGTVDTTVKYLSLSFLLGIKIDIIFLFFIFPNFIVFC